jgi:excisionase family DNA binding protein
MERNPDVLDRAAVARRLGVSYTRIRQLENRGRLRPIKVGGKWLFDRKEVEAYAADRLARGVAAAIAAEQMDQEARAGAHAKTESDWPNERRPTVRRERDWSDELVLERERDALLRELEIEAARRRRRLFGG